MGLGYSYDYEQGASDSHAARRLLRYLRQFIVGAQGYGQHVRNSEEYFG
jgi:hypothetical protein